MMEDISLKPLTENYIELVRKWRNLPEVAQYMYTEEHITEEQQIKWFEKVKNDPTQVYWLIEYKNRQVGLASLYNIRKQFKTSYWAFYLGDTSIRGAGIGAKIEFNVLNYVFEELGLNKLLCEVFTTNEKVIAMHEKFGFRREGYFREHVFKNNIFYDVISLAMLKKEWSVLQPHFKEKIYREAK